MKLGSRHGKMTGGFDASQRKNLPELGKTDRGLIRKCLIIDQNPAFEPVERLLTGRSSAPPMGTPVTCFFLMATTDAVPSIPPSIKVEEQVTI